MGDDGVARSNMYRSRAGHGTEGICSTVVGASCVVGVCKMETELACVNMLDTVNPRGWEVQVRPAAFQRTWSRCRNDRAPA